VNGIVGAWPQFIEAAPVSQVLERPGHAFELREA